MRALVLAVLVVAGQTTKPPVFFQSTLPAAETKGKQAVVETSAGTFVMQLLPDAAPNHVGYFITLARDGRFNGTLFHRVIKYGIIQGGDPLSKDPAKAAQYGTGGLNVLRAEINNELMTAGAVAGVLIPNQRDSAGAQFFVCATDQASLQGQYTIFARVVEGLEVVQAISAVPAGANGQPATRVEIKSVTIRDTPPPVKDPIVDATAAELRAYHAVLETTKGSIELEFLPDKAPDTVRQFLVLARAGVYDGVGIHRVVPNFVIQTGALAFRDPLTPAQQQLVHNLPPEFSDVPNLPGVVSMARGDDPGSGSTSFFICIGECRALDGKYTVFAKVTGSLAAVQALAAVDVDGERPKEALAVTRIVVKK